MDELELEEDTKTSEKCLQYREPLTDRVAVLFEKQNLIVKTENEYAPGPLSLWKYDKKSFEFSLLGVFDMTADGNAAYHRIASEQPEFLKEIIDGIKKPFRQSGGILHSKEMCQIRKASDNVYFNS